MANSQSNKAAGTWKALLICPNRQMVAELAPLLLQHLPLVPVFEVEVYPALRSIKEIVSSQDPGLCFLDVSTDRERALALIGELSGLRPGIQVVVLMSGKDPDLILRSLRQGSNEFLIQPFTSDQMEPALDRLARQNPNGRGLKPTGRIYCTMPVKGACGASTIACNLAFQWKRLGSKKILLADLDPLTGTLSFLLKLKSNYSFVDAVTRGTSLDADLWKGMVTTHQGVDVMLSPEMPVDGINELQDASGIVEYSRQAYDTVILDSSGAYGEWSLALARACDELLLVTTNELPALQAAQRTLSYLERNRVERSKIKLLINRYNREIGLDKEMIETALHTEVFHLMPSDYEAVQRALMDGKPISLNSTFGKSLAALAERLAGRDESVSVCPKKSTLGLGGLLSFLTRS